jgi:hypothetical protein
MMNALLIMSIALLCSCSGSSDEKTQPNDSLATVPAETEILDSNTIASNNAHEVMLDSTHPASVCDYFFASLILGNEDWHAALPALPDRSSELNEELEMLFEKKVIRYTFDHFDAIDDVCNVTMYLVFANGEETDYMAMMRHREGKWVIVNFTTAIHG